MTKNSSLSEAGGVAAVAVNGLIDRLEKAKVRTRNPDPNAEAWGEKWIVHEHEVDDLLRETAAFLRSALTPPAPAGTPSGASLEGVKLLHNYRERGQCNCASCLRIRRDAEERREALASLSPAATPGDEAGSAAKVLASMAGGKPEDYAHMITPSPAGGAVREAAQAMLDAYDKWVFNDEPSVLRAALKEKQS